MDDFSKSAEDIKKYVKKLLKSVEYDSVVFSFGNKKLVTKSKIDDIICCIDSSFPAKYKEWLKYAPEKESKKITSNLAYIELKLTVQNKFFLSGNYYLVDTVVLRKCIHAIETNIEKDLSYVYKLI